MEQIKLLTAEEAKKLADSTGAVLKHCSKFIQEEAKEGRTCLLFDLTDLSVNQVNNLKTTLVNSGYEISHDDKDVNCLIIKW